MKNIWCHRIPILGLKKGIIGITKGFLWENPNWESATKPNHGFLKICHFIPHNGIFFFSPKFYPRMGYFWFSFFPVLGPILFPMMGSLGPKFYPIMGYFWSNFFSQYQDSNFPLIFIPSNGISRSQVLPNNVLFLDPVFPNIGIEISHPNPIKSRIDQQFLYKSTLIMHFLFKQF